jgi:hypothetical protein
MKSKKNLRLFAVCNVDTDILVRKDGEILYFSDKTRAKAYRRELEQTTGRTFCVVVGVDHWRYKGID